MPCSLIRPHSPTTHTHTHKKDALRQGGRQTDRRTYTAVRSSRIDSRSPLSRQTDRQTDMCIEKSYGCSQIQTAIRVGLWLGGNCQTARRACVSVCIH
mmetsp:Transcript_5547/g.13152  ORF Transcript_5547/g.13152 Transcript_5547/m.13152 type:complete len:98 (-) Transcript_5547:207-500(-)